MVLLAGPRQCGKTSLAKELIKKLGGSYYSWDDASDRKKLRTLALDESAHLWALDEIHKYRGWRNWLKGLYDKHGDQHPIFVTGSARLDLYHRGGDSLAGRYFLHHLHPLTLAELTGPRKLDSFEDLDFSSEPSHAQETMEALLKFGGFPEPFFKANETFLRRWQANYLATVIREDIATLEDIKQLDKLEMLFERCPELVGSVLSINNLRNDLETAFDTVKNWVAALERVYGVFRVPPFGGPRLKAVKKEQKLYMWHWPYVESQSARLENCVAVHLLRFVHYAQDVWGEKAELRYFRSTVGHEVDFVILQKNQPRLAVEVKTQPEGIDKGLNYFLERNRQVQAFQLHLHGELDTVRFTSSGQRVRCMSVSRFLSAWV